MQDVVGLTVEGENREEGKRKESGQNTEGSAYIKHEEQVTAA